MENPQEDSGKVQDRAEIWQQRLMTQERSGLSARQFCAEHGQSLPQLYYWRRRLRLESGGVVAPGDGGEAIAPAFVELGLAGSCPSKDPVAPLDIRLDLGGGCVLSIRRG
jgi:hypothetical protein